MKPFAGPFGRDEAAHLLRRASWSATSSDVTRAVESGLDATIARLLGGAAPAANPEADRVESSVRTSDERDLLAGAFLLHATTTAEPLRELLVHFWHNHFVSALSKVREGRMMLDQMATFRAKGLGPFQQLTSAVARDPAMVRYLDSERSTKSEPNENFARELFELFTMGVGPYTERDIQEAARAFTGWHLRAGRFQFSAASHDDGEKRVLGIRRRLDGDAVVAITCTHPATATFMARKFARQFVADAPDDAVVDEIATSWREHDGHVGAIVSEILRSDTFFAPRHRFAVTRTPAALVVATTRHLGPRTAPRELARACQRMGQSLLDPPTVKGYAGGASWINPATLLARRSFTFDSAVKAVRTVDAVSTLAQRALESTSSLIAVAHDEFALMLADDQAGVILAAAREAGDDARALAIGLILAHPDFQRC